MEPTPRTSKLTWHQHSRQWRVCISRKTHYLGPDLTTAQDRYRVLQAEALSLRGRAGPTVRDLVARVQEWADERYAKSGSRGGEARVWYFALKWLEQTVVVRLPGRHPRSFDLIDMQAGEFTALHLVAVQKAMMAAGRQRGYVNSQVKRIRRAFAQARLLGLVTAETVADLRTVPSIPAGHAGVEDNGPVRPVSDAHLDAACGQLTHAPHIAAIVRLLQHSGMRIGEALTMTVDALDTSGPLWIYTLRRHKTAHRFGERRIFLGPQAQKVLLPWLELARATMRTDALLWPTRSSSGRSMTLTDGSVRKVIQRACVRAGIPPFHPHQIRHRAATKLVESMALKAVRATLGHRSEATSRGYAELESLAMEQARQQG